MSRNPYCPQCGVVESIHSGVYCSRLSKSEKLNATLRETIHGLRAELKEARAVIQNTAATVQAFRQEADKARTEAEKARMDWHAAENELWLGDLREQIEKLREQRDRALEIAEQFYDNSQPYDGASTRCWRSASNELRGLLNEVEREKETK
jgi:chromosome segregation ATPase